MQHFVCTKKKTLHLTQRPGVVFPKQIGEQDECIQSQLTRSLQNSAILTDNSITILSGHLIELKKRLFIQDSDVQMTDINCTVITLVIGNTN